VQEIDKSEFVEIPRFLAGAAITHRGAASSEGSSGKLTPEQSETVEKTGFSGPTAPRLRVRLGAPDGRFGPSAVSMVSITTIMWSRVVLVMKL
jgi:hypothetical protein